MKARAGTKFFSTLLFKHLLALPGLDPESVKSYRLASTCCEKMQQNGTKLTSRYCNNRLCLTCNRIRTAKAINGYLQPVEQMGKKFFVTLTIPNVPGFLLREYYKLMSKELRKIFDCWRKMTGTRISGLRKFEVTFNAFRNDFHPHFHLLVDRESAANFIIEQWLERFPRATDKAQDVREATPGTLKELFKYSTKLINSFVEKVKTNKGKTTITKKERAIYPHALHIIHGQLKGLRIFQPFGYLKKLVPEVTEEVDEIDSQHFENLNPDECREWTYNESDATWIDGETGEILIDFKKPDNLTTMFRRPREPG